MSEVQRYMLDLGLDPNDPRARRDVAVICIDNGLLKDAFHLLSKVTHPVPESAQLFKRLAESFCAASDFNSAEQVWRAAQLAFPEDPALQAELGKFFRTRENHPEALSWLARSLERRPGDALTQEAYATTLLETNQIDQAIHHFETARRLGLNSPECLCRLGTAYLSKGNLKEGFALYEQRFNISFFNSKRALPACPIPIWKGESLAGKTILILPEQGKGDNIQFIRYSQLLARQGAKVWMAADASLRSLFQTVPSIDRVLSAGDHVVTDFLCPLMSLPNRFGTTLDTIPAAVPYLVPPHKVTLPRRSKGTLGIGLIWKSSPLFAQAALRDISIDALGSLFAAPGCTFYSLQYGSAASEIEPFLGPNVIDLTPTISSFSDTAAYLMEMDLIVTVDTAGAHLAGALGRTVWTFLPFVPDWRWMLDTTTTPWYPTMRLYRQTELGNWNEPITRLKKDFNDFLALRHSSSSVSGT